MRKIRAPRGYLLFIIGLVLGILFTSIISSIYYKTSGGRTITGLPEEVEITFLYTSEKQSWIEEVTPKFEEWFELNYGIRVKVKLIVAGTHETINMILRGTKPTIWSPASSIWIPYLIDKWMEEHPGENIVEGWVPLVYSPIVIAGWSSLVEEYNITCFMDLYRLASSSVDFKWGHPDPRLSNGGLMVVLLEFSEAIGKTPDRIEVSDLSNETVLNIVKTIESKAVAYGKSTGFFGSWASDSGPQAITFFGVYESVAMDNSLKAEAKWGDKIVSVYPSFGTLLSDHPFVILNASWVDQWQKFVASKYLFYLLQPEVQYKAEKHGFRPANPSVPIDEEIFNPRKGISKEIPVRILKAPSGEVLEAILAVWEKVKNPGV